MFTAAIIFSALGLATFVFGFWGKSSEAGQRYFDEMAGMIPYFSYYLSFVLLFIAVVLWAIIIYRMMGQPGE